MQLLLIRHGQSVGNAANRLQGQADFPLSALGRAQVQRLAERLAHDDADIEVIYTSSLTRAIETAQIVAQAINAPVVQDARLCEYNAGILNGLTFDEIREHYPALYRSWTRQTPEWLPIPGEEGRAAFNERVAQAFNEIVARHRQDGRVALVSHGGALASLMACFLACDPHKRHPFRFGNASLTIIRYDQQPSILMYNDTCHIQDMTTGGTDD